MAEPGRPLTGVRVADLTMIWAGPYATKILADQGAEVIKIESPRAWDNIRTLLPPPMALGEHWWNTNFYLHEYSRNKKSLTLDLGSPEGKAVFARLVAQCDVLVENYRTDVMDNLGLSYEWLREQREDIIVVGMAGFGKTGPERNAMGYGPIIEMLSGLTSTSGYGDDGVPYKSGISYGDPIAGIAAAGAVATALVYRERTGKGQYIDVAQREAMSTMLGEFFMDWSMNGRLAEHQGNGHDWMAPHNIYPCAGEEEWIAICVRSDAEWDALKRVLGQPEWAEQGEFSDQILRWEHREQLDRELGAWTSTRAKTEIFEALRAERVPSSPVWKSTRGDSRSASAGAALLRAGPPPRGRHLDDPRLALAREWRRPLRRRPGAGFRNAQRRNSGRPARSVRAGAGGAGRGGRHRHGAGWCAIRLGDGAAALVDLRRTRYRATPAELSERGAVSLLVTRDGERGDFDSPTTDLGARVRLPPARCGSGRCALRLGRRRFRPTPGSVRAGVGSPRGRPTTPNARASGPGFRFAMAARRLTVRRLAASSGSTSRAGA